MNIYNKSYLNINSDKIMKQVRPLSPHLQIYKPQITSILSIMHDWTGIGLSVGTILIVLWLTSLSLGESFYEYYIIFTKSLVWKINSNSLHICVKLSS